MSSSASKGAKGVDSFDQSLKWGYIPPESSIEYEGLYFNYYFETADEKEKVFKPSFNLCVSPDPLSGKKEYYLSVGLASCLDGDGLKIHGGRPPLNLVIVLDISGSMSSPFTHTEGKSKLEVAKESILSLLSHLSEKDRFGLIAFDDKADIIQPLTSWKEIKLESLKQKITALDTRGGTDLSAGFNGATSLFEPFLNLNEKLHENRIMYLTDMNPNEGITDPNGLYQLALKSSQRKIYASFIGLGIDFNDDLVKFLGKIRATNYFSVKSSKEFQKQMNEEFDYMVTVNCYNSAIDMVGKGWSVERVFGSPGFEVPQQGRLMFMESSFPSLKDGTTMTKGGVILVKVNPDPSVDNLTFRVQYEDRFGQAHSDTYEFNVSSWKTANEYYPNVSARKAILLTRYVSFMKNFIRGMSADPPVCNMSSESGIFIPALVNSQASGTTKKQGQLKPLDAQWSSCFKTFVSHFEKEMDAIGDERLDQELQQLIKIQQLQ